MIYKDAVLCASLNNTCYDPNCEDERYPYLFEAIKLIGDDDFFEDKIIEKFHKSNSFWIVNQLSGILYLFGKDGREKSINALQTRLNEYFTALSKKKCNRYDENIIKCTEVIFIRLCEFHGINYLPEYAENIGCVMKNSIDEDIFLLDNLQKYLSAKFSVKKVVNALKKKSEKSENIKYFLDKLLFTENSREESSNQQKINYQMLINAVNSTEDNILRSMAAKASLSCKDIEVLQAADRLKGEKDPKNIYALVLFFIFVDYPYSIDDLIHIYNNTDDKPLKSICLESLSRYNNKYLHDLALDNLRNKTLIKESLGLLIKNFDNDYSFLQEVLEEYKENPDYDFHDLTLLVIKIFQDRKCKKGFEVLSYAYRKNQCSFCRTNLVEIMCKNEIISNEILDECLYDSSEKTRSMVKDYLKNKNSA
ncbi:MAG: hypothetical protein FWC47_02330 [Oscillospiraceae bacterium]|nr:hypothetical protein [Oscillospiraceae bacterium]